MAPSTLPCTAEGGPRETRRESHRLRIEPCPQSCQCRCPQSCPRRRAPPRAGFARRVIEKRGPGPRGPGRSFSRGWSARTKRQKSEGASRSKWTRGGCCRSDRGPDTLSRRIPPSSRLEAKTPQGTCRTSVGDDPEEARILGRAGRGRYRVIPFPRLLAIATKQRRRPVEQCGPHGHPSGVHARHAISPR